MMKPFTPKYALMHSQPKVNFCTISIAFIIIIDVLIIEGGRQRKQHHGFGVHNFIRRRWGYRKCE